MAKVNKVLLVGHCGFDASSLRSTVESAAKGVPVVPVHRDDELDEHADGEALLLINRVLDGRFDAAGGIELIEQLAQRDDPPRMILTSNYADAQQQARQAGALPGFGKSDLRDAATVERLRAAMDDS